MFVLSFQVVNHPRSKEETVRKADRVANCRKARVGDALSQALVLGSFVFHAIDKSALLNTFVLVKADQ